jgi:hypothetical protein
MHGSSRFGRRAWVDSALITSGPVGLTAVCKDCLSYIVTSTTRFLADRSSGLTFFYET